jgi:hypothetical protein
MAMSPRKRGINPEQRRMLQLLARSSNAHSESIMLARGFTNEMLGRLVIDAFATAAPETVFGGRRAFKVVRMRITDAGRQAITKR